MRLPVISNRDEKSGKFTLPSDGWFQIAPIGEFDHPTGIVQVIDKASVDAMVNRFETESKESNFPGLLLDFDHFSNDKDSPSEAAGWIEALANRDDGNAENPANGLWAKIRFSDIGENAVVNGRYRLASPVWNRSECEDLGENKFRPQRLDRCALTNDPVLKGMVPLSNRASGTADNEGLMTRLEAVEKICSNIPKIENRAPASTSNPSHANRNKALASYHSRQAGILLAKGHKGLAEAHASRADRFSNAATSAHDQKIKDTIKSQTAKLTEK